MATTTGVTLSMQAKEPGDRLVSRTVGRDVDFHHALGSRREAYERLLGDALDGNPARFAREDGVEAAWRVVQPLLDEPGPIRRYPRDTWGHQQRTGSSPATAAGTTRRRAIRVTAGGHRP